MTDDLATRPRVVIGVIGSGTHEGAGPLDAHVEAAAEAVGRAIAERGGVTLTGGEGGVMAAAARGARAAGGLTIGVLRGLDRVGANPYLDLALPTGLGRGRNLVVVRGSDALVMVGGGAGSLNELAVAYAEGTPVVLLRGTGGWSDRLPAALVDGAYLDERRTTAIDVLDAAIDAVERAFERAAAAR